MTAQKALIEAKSLEDFLSLFNPLAYLNHLSLRDRGHPSSDDLDEKILNGTCQIDQLIHFEYSFDHLVHFQAEVGSMRIELVVDYDTSTRKETEVYEIHGTNNDLRYLEHKVIQKNALEPERFKITIQRALNT